MLVCQQSSFLDVTCIWAFIKCCLAIRQPFGLATHPISLGSGTCAGAQDLIMTYYVIIRKQSNNIPHILNVLCKVTSIAAISRWGKEACFYFLTWLSWYTSLCGHQSSSKWSNVILVNDTNCNEGQLKYHTFVWNLNNSWCIKILPWKFSVGSCKGCVTTFVIAIIPFRSFFQKKQKKTSRFIFEQTCNFSRKAGLT